MNWKEFFKPTVFKIVLFLVLFYLTYMLFPNPVAGTGPNMFGFPLNFLGARCYPQPLLICFENVVEFSLANFLVDVIIWYFASSLILWIYRNQKKK